jgi:hypothetical protein
MTLVTPEGSEFPILSILGNSVAGSQDSRKLKDQKGLYQTPSQMNLFWLVGRSRQRIFNKRLLNKTNPPRLANSPFLCH